MKKIPEDIQQLWIIVSSHYGLFTFYTDEESALDNVRSAEKLFRCDVSGWTDITP